jgi:hypothetical protein
VHKGARIGKNVSEISKPYRSNMLFENYTERCRESFSLILFGLIKIVPLNVEPVTTARPATASDLRGS